MLILSSYFPITSPTVIFFVVLLIILSAPIIMGKLRIPHIIGMVLAGVLVGRYGLNILERDSSFELFGKVGLLYIMFLAGLEMDLESVKKNSRRFLLFGLLTCLIPLLMTYFMAMWLLGYSGQASFLLGCIMASNTLIAYPIISRYGLGRDSSVMLSVGSSMISFSSRVLCFKSHSLTTFCVSQPLCSMSAAISCSPSTRSMWRFSSSMPTTSLIFRCSSISLFQFGVSLFKFDLQVGERVATISPKVPQHPVEVTEVTLGNSHS